MHLISVIYLIDREEEEDIVLFLWKILNFRLYARNIHSMHCICHFKSFQGTWLFNQKNEIYEKTFRPERDVSMHNEMAFKIDVSSIVIPLISR